MERCFLYQRIVVGAKRLKALIFIAMARKRRVPEVLWRLFHNRARTLADTIISLVPSSPNCQCEGPPCLRCSGGDSMSFLLRQDDPSDYRKLLTHCFVVVRHNALMLSAFRANIPWSQHEIVQWTIDTIMSERPGSPNVLCNGYDKFNLSSHVDLVTRSAWVLLLDRIGSGMMCFLLKNTSIFLPLSQRNLHQVAGPPVSGLCFKISKQVPCSEELHPSHLQSGSKRKKKAVDGFESAFEKQQARSRNIDRKNFRAFIKKESDVHTTAGANNCSNSENPNTEFQHSTNKTKAKRRKCRRQFSWQRHEKRRQLNIQEPNTVVPGIEINTEREILSATSHPSEKMPKQCPCCPVFQALSKVRKRVQIHRQILFYNSEGSSSVFPRNHILRAVAPNFSGATLLIRDIFGLSNVNMISQTTPCFHNHGSCPSGSVCLYHSLVKLFKTLIRKARCCRHLRLLDKHCAIPPPSLDENANGSVRSTYEDSESVTKSIKNLHARVQAEGNLPVSSLDNYTKRSKETSKDVSKLIMEPEKLFCLKNQVVSFLWAVCRSIIPPDLLGTPCNMRILRKNISKFIHLRRFEHFSLKQCLYKLKTSKFLLLANAAPSTTMKNVFMERWIFWLFSSLVVPIIQANFYVSESENGRQDVFYYRKSVWEKLTNTAIGSLKYQKKFQLLDNVSLRNVLRNRQFGFSKIRLRPKDDGIRVLANLGAASKIRRKDSLSPKGIHYHYFKPVNYVLRDLHVVLKDLQRNEPKNLGSSVFDYNDVYNKLCPFLINLKNGSAAMPGAFIVISDASKAFDSIDQDKLLAVMKDVIWKDQYLIKQSRQVVCTKKSLWVRDILGLADSSVPSSSFHGILVDQWGSKKLRKEDLYFNLVEHVKHNVLQFDKKFYLQDVGIPQGSILSSLLCSFYYGHMEREVIFPYLERSCEDSSAKYILLRFIDDFLFISTSRKHAASFFTRLRRGFREYNCYMNEGKFSLNFDLGQHPELSSNRVCVGEDGISFLPWSGLLINCCTLEVQADYTRYLNNHLSSSLTVCWQDKPGRQLKAKLRNYMRPKCHPIFYDSNINSAAVVRLNIYQSFLLCAMKFHCYIRALSNICKLEPRHYFDIIEKSFRYMYMLIKKRMYSINLGSNLHPILRLRKEEVEWLGFNAYSQVLKRKQSQYKELLSFLCLKLVGHSMTKNATSDLQYAVDDSHSSLLWKIKY